MFDWEAAEEVLYTISKDQVARFLGQADCDDLYGLGYFCDPIEGVMLVANTRRYHAASLREYGERFGPTDEESFRWDIGRIRGPRPRRSAQGRAGEEETPRYSSEPTGLKISNIELSTPSES